MRQRNVLQAPVGPSLINKHNVPLSYDKAKAKAIDNQPLVADFVIDKVELGRGQIVKLNDRPMALTDGAYNQFLQKVLEVHPAFVKKFRDVTDEKTELKMLATLQKGLAAKQGSHVKVLANPQTQTIVGFQPGSFNYITNAAMLAVFEQVMNEYPELSLRDFYLNPDGTLVLNVRTDKMRNFGINPSTGEGEDFLGGLTFRNSVATGTGVGHNCLRQVCTNGLIRLQELSKFSISGDSKQLQKFFNSISAMAQQGFMDGAFVDNMKRAQEVEASVAELRRAGGIITKYSRVETEEVNNFLPIRDVTKFLAKKGIQYAELKDGQARNCRTGVTLWDLVNHVTYFGSHDLNQGADFGRIQAAAGAMLDRKSYDGENFVYFN